MDFQQYTGSWGHHVVGLLHYNAKQFMTMLSVCTLMKFKNLSNSNQTCHSAMLTHEIHDH